MASRFYIHGVLPIPFLLFLLESSYCLTRQQTGKNTAEFWQFSSLTCRHEVSQQRRTSWVCQPYLSRLKSGRRQGIMTSISFQLWHKKFHDQESRALVKRMKNKDAWKHTNPIEKKRKEKVKESLRFFIKKAGHQTLNQMFNCSRSAPKALKSWGQEMSQVIEFV